MIKAKILQDSISPNGDRLTTMEVTMHRWVLAELNTHRVFSRNSRSSRAVPLIKKKEGEIVGGTIFEVLQSPAYPVEWGKNIPGMSASEELDPISQRLAKKLWTDHMRHAVETVEKLSDLGLHKQVANRLLEPFMWHTVLITSTHWQNFFDQRVSWMAQPEIRVAAEAMLEAYNASVPSLVNYKSWHTPLLTSDAGILLPNKQKGALHVSAARCARVSYMTHDGIVDIAKDLELYSRLMSAEPKHWSPLEHVATPVKPKRWFAPWRKKPFGNFDGWAQLRHLPKWQ